MKQHNAKKVTLIAKKRRKIQYWCMNFVCGSVFVEGDDGTLSSFLIGKRSVVEGAAGIFPCCHWRRRFRTPPRNVGSHCRIAVPQPTPGHTVSDQDLIKVICAIWIIKKFKKHPWRIFTFLQQMICFLQTYFYIFASRVQYFRGKSTVPQLSWIPQLCLKARTITFNRNFQNRIHVQNPDFDKMPQICSKAQFVFLL